MIANESSLAFLVGEQTQFVIPFFQRGYVWEEDNWAQLLDNLEKTESGHYLGSLILKNDGHLNKNNCYSNVIIDGQQRLTTLSILFRAILDTVNVDGVDSDIIDIVSNEIYKRIFIRKDTVKKYTEDNRFPKLVPGFHEKEIYDILIQTPDKALVLHSKNNLVECYKYFLNELDFDRAVNLYKLLTNETILFVVRIDLNNNDNAQAIFDTTNASGVELTCADIVKNDLFLRIDDENDRLSFYKKTWGKFIDGDGTGTTDDDTYKYWMTQYNKKKNLENLLYAVSFIQNMKNDNGADIPIFDPWNNSYEELAKQYKKYFNQLTDSGAKAFIQKLMKYAIIYRTYLTVDKDHQYISDEIPRYMFSLKMLHAETVLFPYFLKIFDENTNDDGSFKSEKEKSIVINKLKDIERAFIRASICANVNFKDKNERPSFKNLNKNITHVIKSNDITELFTLDQWKSIDDDSKVKEGLLQIDNKTAATILFLLNLKKTKEQGKTTNSKAWEYNYELEHIMPQEFITHWGLPQEDVFGNKLVDSDGNEMSDEEKKEYRSNYVYQIGNMIIITPSANKSIKNYALRIKMEGDTTRKNKNGETRKNFQGYKDFLTEQVSKDILDIIETSKNTYCWTEKMISERTETLTKEILDYWK